MNITEKEIKQALIDRHSVRQYLEKSIAPDIVDEIKSLIEECNKEGNLHLQFVDEAGDTLNKLFNKRAGLGTAPSVIACIGPDDDTLDERIGYYGQKIVLYAQALGLNTCWAGTFNKKECDAAIDSGEKMSIVIAIGYGETQGKARRSKTKDDVVEGNGEKPLWFYEGVEAALLAPTAINQQKFKISMSSDGTVKITDKGGILSKIDLGIVKYNFEIGSGKKLFSF